MAIHARAVRPLTESFAVPWRHDEALGLPDAANDNADPGAFDAAYTRCVETLDFGPITREGQRPTLFHFKPITGSVMRELLAITGGNFDQSTAAVAFRLALVTVENFESCPKLERKVSREEITRADGVAISLRPLGPMLVASVVDFFDELAIAGGQAFGSLVTELGSIVLTRSISPSPHR